MAQVQLEQVSKIYPGGVRAVDGVSLSIADREFVVLVGPSGCGKSTTLRMVAGLEEISEGVIRIGDRVVNEVPPRDRDIAMVFQNYALYPHMSVYKNMAFGLKLKGLPKGEIDRRVLEAAKILGLDPYLDRKPKALSGGQRQRVAVGRAIVREPAAFLFDEPLSNLDAKLRVTTRAELKRLHQRLLTTSIYVTHDQEEAMTLGDRIVVMKDGRIQQAQGPLETYEKPANRFVAGFIGTPPMNFFDGLLRCEDGRLEFEEGIIDTGGALTLTGKGFRLGVPQVRQKSLAGWVGRHIVLGIRPEHLCPDEGQTCNDSRPLEMRLNVVETLGSVMDVYLSTAVSEHVVGRITARPGLRIGSKMMLNVDPQKVHFFEPGETGMNLSLLNEAAHADA